MAKAKSRPPLRRSRRIMALAPEIAAENSRVASNVKRRSTKRRNVGAAKKRVKASSSSASHTAAPLRQKELRLTKQGYSTIVGCDEAGRGPLAGPVVAAACHVPVDLDLDAAGLQDIHDSKKLNKEKREKLFSILTQHADIRYATGIVSAKEIDRINILQASMLGMHNAVEALDIEPDYVLIDGPRAPWGHPRAIRKDGSVREADPPMPTSIKMCEPVIKGDSKVLCIAAASIIAKVTRDRIMDELDAKYPGYGFASHAGYPTRAHVAAVHKLGPCKVHRMTFAPLKHM